MKTDSPDTPLGEKTLIRYHRSHRRITFSPQILLGGGLTLVLLLVLLGVKLWLLPDFTQLAAHWLRDFFAQYGILPSVDSMPYFGNASLRVLNLLPERPSQELCIVVAGGGAAFLLLFYRLPLPRPLVVICNVVVFIVGFFAVLFLALPEYFDESGLMLHEFFLQIALVTGFALPALFWLVLAPLPTGAGWKALYMLVLEGVLIALFFLKYGLFVLMCAKGTYLIAPLVIFFLCSILDIVYLITFYSLIVSGISRRVARDTRVWQWA